MWRGRARKDVLKAVFVATEEKGNSVHKDETSVAEDVELKVIAEEKDNIIKNVDFGKEAEVEKDFAKSLLAATEEKD